ncbi:hypothetical protein N7510_007152 [Penicillium lagena]|uniref:uncharacterized protein n=1 Tax=Penicillium lagena TaxID=94218 RepID=UPI0025410648|nr:uncharacterized protein N7510_007152 [Penicillium lagena]KAJ5610433.1 hypothetical protein N7510_007152 [Penicillium lagena]
MGVKKGPKNQNPEESLTKAVSERSGDEELAKYQGLFYSAYWPPISFRSSKKWGKTPYLLPATPETTKSSFCASAIAVTYTSDANAKMFVKEYLILCDPYFARKSLAWARGHIRDVKSLDDLPVRAGILLIDTEGVLTLMSFLS